MEFLIPREEGRGILPQTFSQIFTELKAPTLEAARKLALSVDVQGTRIGRLVPVGPWVLIEHDLIGDFVRWRGEAMEMFFARFTPSAESMREYLRLRPLASEDRILFVVEEDRQFVGHIGLSNVSNNSAEIDNVIRGQVPVNRGLMLASQRTLCQWAFQKLGVNRLVLRVISTNHQAKKLYEKVGFELVSASPLRVISMGEVMTFVPCKREDASVDFTSDIMELTVGKLRYN